MEVLFPIIFVVLIAELIVSGTWQSFYFRAGIPLFKKSIRLSSPPELSVDDLNRRFERGVFMPLRFKQMSPHEVAFREAFSGFRLLSYTPVIHGLIRYDETTRELHMIGFANWFALLFIIVLIAIASSFPSSEVPFDVMFTVFPLALFALLYFIQFKRYTGVFKALSPEKT